MPATATEHSAPSLALMGLEPLRALFDFAQAKLLPAQDLPRGRQDPVLVIPGLATNHLATAVLRERLGELDYLVEDWGQGLNTGPQDEDLVGWLEPVRQRLEDLVSSTGRKAHVIGWSLGGIAARELAKQAPQLVRKVITLGTPFAGLETSTNAGWAYELLNGGRKAELSAELARQLRQEPPVPTVSVYSKTDGIVSWSACVQPGARRTRHIELEDVSHFGMVLSPKVLKVVAQELAVPSRYVRGVRASNAV